MAIPNALSIAGIDPSGGAGLLADLKTFAAHRVFGAGVVVALTAQNTRGVAEVLPVPPSFLRRELEVLFEDVPIQAAKTGMLADVAHIEAVAEQLAARNIPLVVDPVMVATSGDLLLEPRAVEALKKVLLPLATVITPNLDEARILLGQDEPIRSEAEMRSAALRLRELLAPKPGRWVVLKGGHLANRELVDVVCDGQVILTYRARRRAAAFHGTGCTLSASITAYLARLCHSDQSFMHEPLAEPEIAQKLFGAAHRYLQRAIAASRQVTAGQGAAVLNHGVTAPRQILL